MSNNSNTGDPSVITVQIPSSFTDVYVVPMLRKVACPLVRVIAAEANFVSLCPFDVSADAQTRDNDSDYIVEVQSMLAFDLWPWVGTRSIGGTPVYREEYMFDLDVTHITVINTSGSSVWLLILADAAYPEDGAKRYQAIHNMAEEAVTP